MSEFISVRQLYIRGKSVFSLILKYWYTVLLFACIGGGLGYYYETLQTENYSARMSFTVKEGGGDGGSGLGSVLGQFGLGARESNLDKIIEIGKSKLLIYQVLVDTVTLGGKTKSIGNHIIDVYPELFDGLYDVESSDEAIRLKSLKSVYNNLLGDLSKGGEGGLIKINYNFTTQILYIWGGFKLEDLSIVVIERLYDKISDVYAAEATAKKANSLYTIEGKKDSLYQVISQKQSQLAFIQDQSSNLFRRSDAVKQNRLQLEIQILYGVYGEILKNVETTRFLADNKTPFFQIIDRPIKPLNFQKRRYKFRLFVGAFAGVLFSGILIVSITFLSSVSPEND